MSEDGVFLNPDSGDIVATGQVKSYTGVDVPAKTDFTVNGTPFHSVLYYDLNSTGLSNCYTKPETYSKDEVISCIDGLLSSIQETYYSKNEVSSIIDGYEFGYALNVIPYSTGTICLRNSVNNVVRPSADISVSFPRTVINSNQLGREFYLQVCQPSAAVSVSFLGYEGEDLSFVMQDGEEPLDMLPDSRYLYYFCELQPSLFLMRMARTVSCQPPEEEYVSSFYLVNGEQNCLTLAEDCNLVFPAQTTDTSGNPVPRDFTLYLQQSDVSAYRYSLRGRDGEVLSFELGNVDSLPSADLSCRYFMGFSEIERNGLSSTFVAFGKKLKAVQ